MAEEAKRATTGDTGAGQQAPQARVLVVEEDRVEGGMLAFHLRREGLVVMLAASGDEAIDALAWAPPDAIMVEAHGRELDGFDVIRALGDMQIRVFLLADGPLDLEDDLEALRLGVMDVFTKPVDPALVARRVIERPTPTTRGSIADLPDSGISGELDVHPVTQLLSLCHRHRMNARLHVELDGDWGVLLVRHGDVIDAESPGATGRDAAFAAIRRASGTFVLFPLSLDAEELSRDDVVRADAATLFTEALGRPPTRQVKTVRPQDQQVIEIELHARESPRGPLSRPAVRRPGTETGDTLEYEASPSVPANAGASPGPETRARIQRQVGIPIDEPPSPRPAAVSAPEPLAASLQPTAAAPVETEPQGHDRADNAPRRRVTTGAQVRERASQIRRPTRPMPISSPPMEPVRPAEVLAALAAEEVRQPTTRPPVPPQRRALPETDRGQRAKTVAGGVPVDAMETLTASQEWQNVGGAALLAPPPEVLETLPAGSPPPDLPASARVVRPPTQRTATEPDLNEPTDISEKHPITDAPRVRRPSTGMFRIGDERAPRERTDKDVLAAPAEEEAPRALRAPTRRLHWGVLALAAAAVLLLAFVIARVAAPGDPPAPAPTPVVTPLDSATQARIRFGEAAAALRLGDATKAEPLFEALVGDADRPDGALAGLAMMYLKEGKFDDAEPVLEALNRQKQGDPRVQAWLGLVHARQGRVDDARASFRSARQSASGALAERLDELLATFE